MAMANSVEGRYPFLDHRVVEFASRLPAQLKMKVLDQKYLLKRSFEGRIPVSIQNRAKQPYRAPDGKSFIRSGAPEYVHELLSPSRIASHGVFDPVAVSALVAKFQHGRAIGMKDNMALVGILSTQLALEQFIHGHDRRDAQWQPISETRYAASL
jgi:asparagine synthase (glutamine-hydrolysing)